MTFFILCLSFTQTHAYNVTAATAAIRCCAYAYDRSINAIIYIHIQLHERQTIQHRHTVTHSHTPLRMLFVAGSVGNFFSFICPETLKTLSTELTDWRRQRRRRWWWWWLHGYFTSMCTIYLHLYNNYFKVFSSFFMDVIQLSLCVYVCSLSKNSRYFPQCFAFIFLSLLFPLPLGVFCFSFHVWNGVVGFYQCLVMLRFRDSVSRLMGEKKNNKFYNYILVCCCWIATTWL